MAIASALIPLASPGPTAATEIGITDAITHAITDAITDAFADAATIIPLTSSGARVGVRVVFSGRASPAPLEVRGCNASGAPHAAGVLPGRHHAAALQDGVASRVHGGPPEVAIVTLAWNGGATAIVPLVPAGPVVHIGMIRDALRWKRCTVVAPVGTPIGVASTT